MNLCSQDSTLCYFVKSPRFRLISVLRLSAVHWQASMKCMRWGNKLCLNTLLTGVYKETSWANMRTNAHTQCVVLSVCEEDLHVKQDYSQFFHHLRFHHTWPEHPDVLWAAFKISRVVRIGQNSWRKRWELIWSKTTARSQTFLLLKVMRGLSHVNTQIAHSLHLFYISIERFFPEWTPV